MSAVRLVGGRVLDPVDGTLEVRDVGIREGRLVAADQVPDAPLVDLGGRILAPGFVDLHGAIVHPERDGAAAVAGGFTTVVASPDHPGVLDRPEAVRALLDGAGAAPCRIVSSAALTAGLAGEDLAEVGLLAAAGAAVVGQGTRLIPGARVLRHALEYAARLDLTVLLRGGESDLERGGVLREGARSTRLGLPGIPPASEEIGIHRIAALARLTGARVHLTHVWTAAGVAALRRVRDEGIALTASTTAAHLGLDPDAHAAHPYDGRLRFVPPLGDDEDRRALVQAAREGLLDAVATDHRPWPPYAQDRPFQAAEAGCVMLDAAFALVLDALEGDVVAAVRLLAAGPRRVLGRPQARLRPGEPADLVLLDPTGTTTLDRPRGAHGNTPLAGARLDGRVVATWVGGQPRYGVGQDGRIG